MPNSSPLPHPLGLALTTALIIPALSPAAPPEGATAAADASNAFGKELYQELRTSGEGDENVFFSAFSISSAFGMLQAGAREKSAEEIAAAFRFPDDPHPGLGGLIGALKDTAEKGDAALQSANALWLMTGYEAAPDFATILTDHYGTDAPTALDFGSDPGGAADTINGWVAEQTKDCIETLVDPGMFDGLTRAVLTNAVYFKGNWASQFDPERTKNGAFTLLDGSEVEAELMGQRGQFGLLQREEYQVLSMPYSEEDLTLAIFLPNAGDGLAAVEAGLFADGGSSFDQDLADVIGARTNMVSVVFPKQKVETTYDLIEPLRSMGIDQVFGREADLTGLLKTGGESLYVSDVVHKGFLEIDETGTEAAAATGIVVKARSLPRTFEFHADHPFLYTIVHRPTGAVLFMGACLDPSTGG